MHAGLMALAAAKAFAAQHCSYHRYQKHESTLTNFTDSHDAIHVMYAGLMALAAAKAFAASTIPITDIKPNSQPSQLLQMNTPLGV